MVRFPDSRSSRANVGKKLFKGGDQAELPFRIQKAQMVLKSDADAAS